MIADHGHQKIVFEPDRTSLPLKVTEKAWLDTMAGKVAKVAIWRRREKLPLPHIVIIGGPVARGKKATPFHTGVSGHLQRRLDEVFAAWRAEDPKAPMLTSDDITFHFAPSKVRSPYVVEAEMDRTPPAEESGFDALPKRVDLAALSPSDLEKISRAIGVHKGGKLTTVSSGEIARTANIVRVHQAVFGLDQGLDVGRLEDIRRVEQVLRAEGRATDFSTTDLDSLVRGIFTLPSDTVVAPEARRALLDFVPRAKEKARGRPIAHADLVAAYKQSPRKETYGAVEATKPKRPRADGGPTPMGDAAQGPTTLRSRLAERFPKLTGTKLDELLQNATKINTQNDRFGDDEGPAGHRHVRGRGGAQYWPGLSNRCRSPPEGSGVGRAARRRHPLASRPADRGRIVQL